MLGRLQLICREEGFKVQDEALKLLVRAAEGGMRDALSLLDQAVSFADGEVTRADVEALTGAVAKEALGQLAVSLLRGKTEDALRRFHLLLDEGKEPVRIVEDLIYFYRDLLLWWRAPQLVEGSLPFASPDEWEEELAAVREEAVFPVIQRLSQAQRELRWTDQPRLFVEVALIQVTQQLDHQQGMGPVEAVSAEGELAELRQKVARLEQAVAELSKALRQGGKEREELSPASQPASKKRSIARSAGPSANSSRLRELLNTASRPLLKRLKQQWPQVLAEVKRRQIMVHAWLRDGEPVACGPSFFLLAFRSPIHRQTTEKKSHRQLIEQVVSALLQTEAELVTIMYNEWEALREQLIAEHQREKQGSTGEEKNASQRKEDPFYTEAVNLVGEELVEVIPETDGEDH